MWQQNAPIFFLILILKAKLVAVAITPSTCIPAMFDSNLYWDTGRRDCGWPWITSRKTAGVYVEQVSSACIV